MTPQDRCTLAERWIESSLDGELSEDLEQQLDVHLDVCDHCRSRFESSMADRKLLDDELEQLSGAFDHLLSEQLTESSIARHEQLMSADMHRADRSRRRRALQRLAAIFLFGSVVFLVGWGASHLTGISSPPPTIAIATWTGSAPIFVQIDGEPDVAIGSEREVSSVDTVSVPAGCELVLTYPDGTTVTVPENSRFELRSEGRRRDVRLLDGLVRCAVAPSDGGFFVTTRLATVRVVGTRFTVEHDDVRNKSGVVVEEGLVEVWRRERPQTRLTLRPGDAAIISRSIQLRENAIPVAESVRQSAAPAVLGVPDSPTRASDSVESPSESGSSDSGADKPVRPRSLDAPVHRGGRRP